MIDTLREPPHSSEAERAVLGSLMIDPSSLAQICDWLGEDDFYRRDHRLIFRAIKTLAEKSEPCDAVTLGEWFEAEGLSAEMGGMTHTLEIANTTPSAANVVAYAEIVAEQSRKRQAINIGTELSGSGYESRTKSGDVIGKAMHELSQMQTTSMRGGLAPVSVALKSLFAEMSERYEQGPRLLGLPTPWFDLNTVTKGLRKATLYIIGARPSMGKTIAGSNIAAFTALRGQKVGFFSLEMGGKEIMARSVAALAGIPFDWVEQPSRESRSNDGMDDSEMYWGRLTRAMTDLINAPLLIDDTPSLTIDKLMARARREHMRSPFDLIVVDHIHDMAIDPKREARHEIGRIAQGGKTLAKEFDIPVVMLAQLNRSVTGRADKRPTMADLRESGEIEQKADVILLMHREDYYDSATHMKGVVEMIPAKGRNIRIDGPIHLANRYDQMRLDDWDGPLPLPQQASEPPSFSRFKKREANA